MEISIKFDRGIWRISPDPARISRGELIRWRFQAPYLDILRTRWTIYFPFGHPFARNERGVAFSREPLLLVVDARQSYDGLHSGYSPMIQAEAPGDYKYGVKLEDIDTGEELGDEDPHLIVR